MPEDLRDLSLHFPYGDELIQSNVLKFSSPSSSTAWRCPLMGIALLFVHHPSIQQHKYRLITDLHLCLYRHAMLSQLRFNQYRVVLIKAKPPGPLSDITPTYVIYLTHLTALDLSSGWSTVYIIISCLLTSSVRFQSLCSCIPKEALTASGSQLHRPRTLLQHTLDH